MIIFAGVPGSGKSMQGRMLADTIGLPWLSTGEFLRMLVDGETRKQMLHGKLLDDKDIIALVQKVFMIVDTDKDFILDGFPRTANQADWLLTQVKYSQASISTVILLTASEEAVTERLLARGRPDDTRESIAERMIEFDQTITPIMEKFRQAGIHVAEVDANASVDAVQAEIIKSLQELKCLPE